jgi:hypothetical protein
VTLSGREEDWPLPTRLLGLTGRVRLDDTSTDLHRHSAKNSSTPTQPSFCRTKRARQLCPLPGMSYKSRQTLPVSAPHLQQLESDG